MANLTAEQKLEVTAETVYVCGEDAPARIILRAIADFLDDPIFEERLCKKAGSPEVTMTVNGIPVPVVKTLAEVYKQLDSEAEGRARKMALAMVTEAGLEPLAQALRDAETSIRNKLGIWDDR